MRPNSLGKSRKTQLVYDLDEIISQRSQASLSHYAGSEADASSVEMTTRRRGPPLQKTLSNKSLPRRRQPAGLSSDEELDDHNGQAGLVNPLRITRRHSAAADGRKHSVASLQESSSSSSSFSLPPSELLETRLSSARHAAAVPRRSGVSVATHVVDDDEDAASVAEHRGGFFSCFGCFKTKSLDVVAASSAASSGIDLKDPLSATIQKILALMSENVEMDTLDKIDQRVVFLLFAALSGEPLLTVPEYEECDAWVDWLSLGFSSGTLDAFERDINRTGSQAMGFMFQLFFALEFTASARLAAVVVRNVHFDPSALFGLFAINCAKWSRDALVAAMQRFDENPTSGSDGPPILVSAKSFAVNSHTKAMGTGFSTFLPVLDWWVSRGSVGDIAAAERRFADSTDTSLKYESFKDDQSFEDRFSSAEEGPPEVSRPKPLGSRNTSSAASLDSVGRRQVRLVGRMDSRIPDIDINVHEDWVLLRQALIAGGLFYTYCVLSFTKFWLQKDLISVETDVARERLNNAYLDKEFVSRLKLSPGMTIPELAKAVEKEQQKVDQLWAASGWTKEDLVGPTHSFQEEEHDV